jgi:hypothetical protein
MTAAMSGPATSPSVMASSAALELRRAAENGLGWAYGLLRGSRPEGKATIELFLVRADAERFIAEVAQDEPEMASLMRIEAIEFAHSLQ